MKKAILSIALCALAQLSLAQGSGAPSSEGQTTTPQGEASAEKAVQARHDKVVARSKARAAKRAAKAASAASR